MFFTVRCRARWITHQRFVPSICAAAFRSSKPRNPYLVASPKTSSPPHSSTAHDDISGGRTVSAARRAVFGSFHWRRLFDPVAHALSTSRPQHSLSTARVGGRDIVPDRLGVHKSSVCLSSVSFTTLTVRHRQGNCSRPVLAMGSAHSSTGNCLSCVKAHAGSHRRRTYMPAQEVRLCMRRRLCRNSTALGCRKIYPPFSQSAISEWTILECLPRTIPTLDTCALE